MPMLDMNSSNLTAELEVKKLQELVWKLERQNEQLRSRSICGSSRKHRLSSPVSAGFCESETFEYFRAHTGGDGTAPGEAEDGSEPSVLDELELLDLKPLSWSDESNETWLYRSRADPCDSVTPLQWCRQVLDRPRLEVVLTRRSLSLQLEQGATWCSSPLSPSHSPTLYRVVGVSPTCTSCSTPHSSEQHAPPLCSPLHPTLHHILSPVRKELLPPLAERTPSFLPHSPSRGIRRSLISSQSSLDGRLGSSDKDSVLGYKLQDLTDVQVMARLQEESLRQDLVRTSSVLTGHRSRSLGFQISSVSGTSDLEEEDGEDDKGYGLLPLPSLQPRLLATRLPHSQAFNSIRDWKQSSPSSPHSTPSTPLPPSSGPASQDLGPGPRIKTGPGPGRFCAGERQDLRPGSDVLRRSMQNLVRTPSMPSVPGASPALLRYSHSFDSSSGLPRLQSSSPQLSRVHSVGSFTSLSWQPLKATAYVSPTIKGSVSTAPSPPRSGLPRPSPTPCSKVAQSARSLTTPQRTWWSLSAPRDVGWRVGCYRRGAVVDRSSAS